jgi:hypothetical protein
MPVDSKSQVVDVLAALWAKDSTAAHAVADAVDAIESASPDGRLDLAFAMQVLSEVATKVSTRELRTLPEIISWTATLPAGMRCVKMLAAVDDLDDDDDLSALVVLHVARSIIESAGSVVDFADAVVEPLDLFLLEQWKRQRAKRPHDWLYHPRQTSLSKVTTKKFLSDLLGASASFREDARVGRIACCLNETMTAGHRHKRLDLVIGEPLDPIGATEDEEHPLRKAKVGDAMMTLEVKACMTAHRQATPRLLDELRSSVEVVKACNVNTIPVALVIVNVSPTFTNPLNLPGPNQHIPREIERLFRKLNERVHLDRGSGKEAAYGGVGIVVVDTDNEGRILEVARGDRVPATHTYERAVGRAARLYESLFAKSK